MDTAFAHPSRVEALAFLKVWTGVLSSLLVLTVFINWLADPAKLFVRGYEKGIAEVLAQGKNVANVLDYDDRLVQRYLMERLVGSRIDWIAIGSSRSMQISSRIVGADIYNLSVAGASIEDFVALTMLSEGIKARSIVYGIDPWVLNRNNGQGRWKSLASEYAIGMAALAGSDPSLAPQAIAAQRVYWVAQRERLSQLLNLQYTLASLKKLAGKDSPQGMDFRSTDSEEPLKERLVLRADGSRIYGRDFAAQTTGQVYERAQKEANFPVYSMEEYSELDPAIKRMLEALLRRAAETRRVVVFLPPWHPHTYGVIKDTRQSLLMSEAWIRETCSRLNILVIGGNDPGRYFCTGDEFFDGMHPRPSCVGKIFDTLRSGRSS